MDCTLMPLSDICRTSPVSFRELKQTLINYRVITELAIETIQCLIAGQVKFFDPLVGENACQIRASMLCDLFGFVKQGDNQALLNTYLAKLVEARDLLAKLDRDSIKFSSMRPLRTILEDLGIATELPKFLIGAILSYLLTITKTFDDQYKKDPLTGLVRFTTKEDTKNRSLLKLRSEVSPQFAKNLDKTARKLLSELSIQYVQREAVNLEDSEEKDRLVALVSVDRIKINSRGLKILPSYPVMIILFNRALEKRTPVILHVDRVDHEEGRIIDRLSLLYKVDVSDLVYTAVEQSCEGNSSEEAFVINSASIANHNGVSLSEFKENLLRHNLKDIILGNFSTHPIYPGQNDALDSLEQCFDDKSDLEYKAYQDAAQRGGLCPINPTLCQAIHCYASVIQNQMNPF